ncbi:MAG: recombination protein O N-terminal domain-containing protein [Gammaproteobacteria bacterium]|nr:recombination protein O N-terminal domain-containing protein [Gammaproteobacteria bacterium]MDE0441541.1 recombination protein O N-terminal domain-containing protein [Gammaproteobacteria bacterium]
MIQPADRQPGYVLHRRAYRESSALVELLTRDFGLVGAVMRGVKRSPRSARDLEPFGRIAVSWRGRGQLVTVLRAETVVRRNLSGDALFAGLYINELLVKTLGREEPVADLFDSYDAAVASLAQVESSTVGSWARHHPSTGDGKRRGFDELEPILRTFERRLLDELGYGIAFDVDVANGRPIEPGRLYRVVDGEGFREVDKHGTSPEELFDGAQIAAMDAGEYRDGAVLRGAKQILRRAIAVRLGGKPLVTRRLFSAARHPTGDRETVVQLP